MGSNVALMPVDDEATIHVEILQKYSARCLANEATSFNWA